MVANQSRALLRGVISLQATQALLVYCVASPWRFKARLTRKGLLAVTVPQ